ncbi:hypothetical protein Cenrod_2161 [Candidatus Symbiobacter mobilis CR]|uniref:Uncharacterized protein n=1 Tax=Candidatus Symbiobacter mobilis CR TaxID=946483 RepID=U5NA83_9BURK|nr:hypothetical protein Cenrod_2161 [Candidatus Symbiobacter mobilis CR]
MGILALGCDAKMLQTQLVAQLVKQFGRSWGAWGVFRHKTGQKRGATGTFSWKDAVLYTDFLYGYTPLGVYTVRWAEKTN